MRKRSACIVVCIAASPVAVAADLPIPFRDEAVERGILYVVSQGEFDGIGAFGCGIALIDLDQDGDGDFVCIGASNGQTGLFRNDGTGHFTREYDSGLPSLMDASGVTAADYDGDGDLDLHFTCWHTEDFLYRNEGHLRFVNVTDEAGMCGTTGAGTGAAWGDYDGDGDLDLYVCNRSGSSGNWTPNYFWHNNGDGTFTEMAEDLGIADAHATMQAAWFDYDNDGDPDLYISTDKGGVNSGSNRLFRNDGGVFTDVSEVSQTNVRIDSMGIGVGDVDANGYLDLYCTNIPSGNPLLMNNGDGTFHDAMKEADVGSWATGWSAHFFDFDNDADDDLYVCNMIDGLNKLYRNLNAFPMEEIAEVSNVACYGNSYALAVGDIDNDGSLDMLVQNHEELIRLFVNQEGGLRNWIKFKVVGVGMNKFAVGARLVARINGRPTMHEIAAGSNYKSTNDYIEHFGLGEYEELELLDIRFPDGATRTLQNAPGMTTWILPHPDLLGDTDGDGDVDPIDLSVFPEAYQKTDFAHDWEWLDFTGNFFIDDKDIDAFMTVYTGPIEDCDEDGMIDAIQIARNLAPDADRDGRLDTCDLLGDLNGDGMVNGADVTLILANWGTTWPDGDFNDDGLIDGADLLVVLASWTL